MLTSTPTSGKTTGMRFSHWFPSLLFGVGGGSWKSNLPLVSGFQDPPKCMKEPMGKPRMRKNPHLNGFFFTSTTTSTTATTITTTTTTTTAL